MNAETISHEVAIIGGGQASWRLAIIETAGARFRHLGR
jgi:hypothetical protein